MLIKELLEGKTNKAEAPKPRNFVAKNAINTGAGAHKDKKKAAKQGDIKHKNKALAEKDVAESATAGATSAANVGIGVAYKNKTGKTYKNSNGTVKNAADVKGANLISGGSIAKR
jgi:hypothetical protein